MENVDRFFFSVLLSAQVILLFAIVNEIHMIREAVESVVQVAG